MSAVCLLGHDWNNSLTCRLCPATRTPSEAILSGLASRRGGDETSAQTLLDAYRVTVLTEAKREVITWLAKKAREDTPVYRLADKVDRGAIRLFLNAAREEATAPAATATPTDTNRRARLLHEMDLGARWKSGDVVAWYERNGLVGLGVRAARHDLATLRDSGAITQHDEKGVRFYTRANLNTRKDVRP